MSQDEMKGLEKLADDLKYCEIGEKEPAIILSDTCDSSISAKFPKPKRNVPPVFLHRPVKFATLIRKVLNLGIKFYRPTIGHHYTKICCQTFDDQKALIQYFKNKNLPHHTYGHPDNRRMKVVFRGLPKDVDLNNLKIELESASIPIDRIHELQNMERAKDRPLLALVVVPNNKEGRKILQVQKYLEHSIEIEPLKPRSMQCFRCQKWGHTQRYCNGRVKCVKCAGDHASQKCTRDPVKDPPKCANCGLEHTSSFKQCPFSPTASKYECRISTSADQMDILPSVCIVPKKLVTLNNYQLLLRGRM